MPFVLLLLSVDVKLDSLIRVDAPQPQSITRPLPAAVPPTRSMCVPVRSRLVLMPFDARLRLAAAEWLSIRVECRTHRLPSMATQTQTWIVCSDWSIRLTMSRAPHPSPLHYQRRHRLAPSVHRPIRIRSRHRLPILSMLTCSRRERTTESGGERRRATQRHRHRILRGIGLPLPQPSHPTHRRSCILCSQQQSHHLSQQPHAPLQPPLPLHRPLRLPLPARPPRFLVCSATTSCRGRSTPIRSTGGRAYRTSTRSCPPTRVAWQPTWT